MWTRMTGSTEKMWKIGLLFLMAQSIPSVPIPHPPRAYAGNLSSCQSRRWGIYQKISARG